MLRNPSLLFCLGLIALASASLAGICGDPDAVETPTGVSMSASPESPTASSTADVSTTPTPAATVTTAHSFGFAETAVLPTARTNDEPMLIGGVIWVDGNAPTGQLLAFINGIECGQGESVLAPDGGIPQFLISIASDADVPGCGTAGAMVTLEIAGRSLDGVLGWESGPQQPLTLAIGPVVAQYFGTFVRTRSFIPTRVVPYIDGVACGYQLDAMMGDEEVGFHVLVKPAELSTGCGRDGATVTLTLEGTQDGLDVELDLSTVAWQPGSPVQVPTVDVRTLLPGTAFPSTETAP